MNVDFDSGFALPRAFGRFTDRQTLQACALDGFALFGWQIGQHLFQVPLCIAGFDIAVY